MTNLNSRALEYTGYYAQGRKKKTFKRARNSTEDWEGFLCQSLMEIIRENESDHI